MPNTNKEGFLFTVELLVEDHTAGLALEKLIHSLNSEHIKDYRILKGMDVGQIIYETIKHNSGKGLVKQSELPDMKEGKPISGQPAKVQPVPAKKTLDSPRTPIKDIMKQMEELKEKGTLIRIFINKGKGIKLNMPCRILNIDTESENITLYNVDEKQVYLISKNEIDDYTVN